VYSLPDTIGKLQWSPSSTVLACLNTAQSTLFLIAVERDTLFGTIDFGSLLKIERLMFSPDGRYLCLFTELRVTVVDIARGVVAAQLAAPKYTHKGAQFRRDGLYFVLLQRRAGRDFVAVYSVRAWHCVRRFEAALIDAGEALWSPDGKCVAVWDGVFQCKVCFYAPDGRLLGQYVPEDETDALLGIARAVWAPSSQFLAVGSFDHKVGDGTHGDV
jgi:hypothetical protein